MSVSSLVLLVVALIMSGVQGHGSGAGSGACLQSSMMPGHGVAAQTSQIPYTIGLSSNKYAANGSITVTLSGKDNFLGFLLMALPEDNQTAAAIGTFDITSYSGRAITQSACSGTAATHTGTFGSKYLNSVVLNWNAPADTLAGSLKFYATVVQGHSVFWVKEPSAVVMVDTNPESGDPVTESQPDGDAATTTGNTSTDPTSTSSATQVSSYTIAIFSTMLWLVVKTW